MSLEDVTLWRHRYELGLKLITYLWFVNPQRGPLVYNKATRNWKSFSNRTLEANFWAQNQWSGKLLILQNVVLSKHAILIFSGATVTSLRSGRPRVQIPVQARYFSRLRIVRTVSVAHSTLYSVSTKALSWWSSGRRPEVEHSPPSSAVVKKEWSYASTPPMCFHDVDGEFFSGKITKFKDEWKQVSNRLIDNMSSPTPVIWRS